MTIIFAFAMATVAPLGSIIAQNSASSAGQQQRRAELAAKYGMNDAQIESYEALVVERDAQYNRINDARITSAERRTQRLAVTGEFRKKVRAVMPTEQYDRWLAERKLKDETLRNANSAKSEQKRQIRQSNTPHAMKHDQVKSVMEEYNRTLYAKFGTNGDHERNTIRQAANYWYANKNLDFILTWNEARGLAVILKEKDGRLTALRAQNLSMPERRTASAKIVNESGAKIKQLLGEQRYAQWSRYKAGEFDRSLKKRYAMSSQQIRDYKTLTNGTKVSRMKLRERVASPEEKAVRSSEIAQQFDEKLRQILSDEQIARMMADKNYIRGRQSQRRHMGPPRGGNGTPSRPQ
ncbi:hypothetical protein FACS1894159_02130 [Bacteroidia bacterium]|nr:hypothetical protein FACS1894159_02130 [Bacteroidia bacterium]